MRRKKLFAGFFQQNIVSFVLFLVPVTMIRRVALFIIFGLYIQCSLAQSLAASLDALLNDAVLHDSDASVLVYDLTADSLLYAHREHKRCRPASVAKVTTVAAALTKLGSGYTIDTHLYECGGNLYVNGTMDPLFDEDDMLAMAQSVSVGMVVDTLFADCSFCDSLYWGPGWAWDDNPYGFQPYISPLLLCGGAVEVIVTPTEKGAAPRYSCTPQSSFYTVVNEAQCSNKELDKLTILRDWLNDSNIIHIRGNCTKETKESLNMYKSADFFVAVLVEKLAALGVTVNNVAFGIVPDSALCIHSTARAIEDVVAEALLESDNICAEALLYHLAATKGSSPFSMEQGCGVVESFMQESLGYSNGYSVYDGSGLSPYNHISANVVTSLLRYIYNNPNIYDIVYPRLPLSGVSGTMKHRTKGTAAYKKVRAKTGTVTGVCTLAGYATAKNGHILAFVLMNSGAKSARKAREWQDSVCDVLCR